MIRALLYIICILFSHGSIALSISCPIDNRFEGNSSQIGITYKADQDTWAVFVKAPLKIDELHLSRVMIGKGKDGNVLAVPLEFISSGDIAEAHFYANALMLSGMSLSVSYGGDCPKTIIVPLKLNKTLNLTPKSGAG